MTKYIIGEFFSSGGATLYKNPSDQTVKFTFHYTQTIYMDITKKRKDPVIHIKCIYYSPYNTCVYREEADNDFVDGPSTVETKTSKQAQEL